MDIWLISYYYSNGRGFGIGNLRRVGQPTGAEIAEFERETLDTHPARPTSVVVIAVSQLAPPS